MKAIGKVKSAATPAIVIGADTGHWRIYEKNKIFADDIIYVEEGNSITIDLDVNQSVTLQGEQHWTPTAESYVHSQDIFIADTLLPSFGKGRGDIIEMLLQQALAVEVTGSNNQKPKRFDTLYPRIRSFLDKTA